MCFSCIFLSTFRFLQALARNRIKVLVSSSLACTSLLPSHIQSAQKKTKNKPTICACVIDSLSVDIYILQYYSVQCRKCKLNRVCKRGLLTRALAFQTSTKAPTRFPYHILHALLAFCPFIPVLSAHHLGAHSFVPISTIASCVVQTCAVSIIVQALHTILCISIVHQLNCCIHQRNPNNHPRILLCTCLYYIHFILRFSISLSDSDCTIITYEDNRGHQCIAPGQHPITALGQDIHISTRMPMCKTGS